MVEICEVEAEKEWGTVCSFHRKMRPIQPCVEFCLVVAISDIRNIKYFDQIDVEVGFVGIKGIEENLSLNQYKVLLNKLSVFQGTWSICE